MYDRHVLFRGHLPNASFKKILPFYKSPNYNRHYLLSKNVPSFISYAMLIRM